MRVVVGLMSLECERSKEFQVFSRLGCCLAFSGCFRVAVAVMGIMRGLLILEGIWFEESLLFSYLDWCVISWYIMVVIVVGFALKCGGPEKAQALFPLKWLQESFLEPLVVVVVFIVVVLPDPDCQVIVRLNAAAVVVVVFGSGDFEVVPRHG